MFDWVSNTPLNPCQPSVAFHIGTSHLFCNAKQITGFYIKTQHQA